VTPTEAAKVLALLTAATRGEKLTVEQAEVWLELLVPLDRQQAYAAAQLLIERQTFFPAWAEFVGAYDDMDPRRAADPTPAEAWAEVCALVRRIGYLGSPNADSFSHPAIHAALRGLGDWADFCAGEEMVNRAHFMKLYPEQLATHRRREQIGLVINRALPETDNVIEIGPANG